mmetsp:Transcript_50465/g.96405  ORF Transcript_50465/g.96405 Transcript_50465/m.96405 type:complete len:683 (-) Transcript_50465:537-2585(-)
MDDDDVQFVMNFLRTHRLARSEAALISELSERDLSADDELGACESLGKQLGIDSEGAEVQGSSSPRKRSGVASSTKMNPVLSLDDIAATQDDKSVPATGSSKPAPHAASDDESDLLGKFLVLSTTAESDDVELTLQPEGSDGVFGMQSDRGTSPSSSHPFGTPGSKTPTASPLPSTSPVHVPASPMADGMSMMSDEYEDDEDPGYLREEVDDTEAFLASLDLSEHGDGDDDPLPVSPGSATSKATNQSADKSRSSMEAGEQGSGAEDADSGALDGFSFPALEATEDLPKPDQASEKSGTAAGDGAAHGKQPALDGAEREPSVHGAGAEEEDLEAEEAFETFDLKIVHRKGRTGFEESKDFPIRINSVVAGRYQVMEFLGSAAFSKAVQALDLQTGMLVCIKIIKNNKDFFDQSLDEIKLLKYINRSDPADSKRVLRLYDFFYHKEHLFIVCELLRANLYEFQKYNRESGEEVYFNMRRLQSIARQALTSLEFLHSLNLIHCDLKPENILIKSYSRCEVKIIDLGSSCFVSDHLSSYVQSRSYRAPEVILGAPYGQKIDVWSMGCILAELFSGLVLFQNDSLVTLLARVVGILGPVPPALLSRSRLAHKYFTKHGQLFEFDEDRGSVSILHPKHTSLAHRLQGAHPEFVEFLSFLLTVDPDHRPNATQALQHPWLSQVILSES